jgi:hypothetical protein
MELVDEAVSSLRCTGGRLMCKLPKFAKFGLIRNFIFRQKVGLQVEATRNRSFVETQNPECRVFRNNQKVEVALREWLRLQKTGFCGEGLF